MNLDQMNNFQASVLCNMRNKPFFFFFSVAAECHWDKVLYSGP